MPDLNNDAADGTRNRHPGQKAIEDHLAKAIISTLVCCLPFGIVAIIHAVRVSRGIMSGDLDAARDASRKANFWGNLSIITGVILVILAMGVPAYMKFTEKKAESLAKVEMAEAARVLGSFESAHSSQVEKSGRVNAADDFSVDVPESEFFTYRMVVDDEGRYVAGFAAKTIEQCGEFRGALVTVYNDSNGTYAHRVEPENMREIAEAMIPDFFKR